MKLLLTGSHGLVGSALSPTLPASGHGVAPLLRQKTAQGREGIFWNPSEGSINSAKLEGFDGVVHLAGESIIGRWTEEKKAKILESRKQGTRLLSETLAKLDQRPNVLIAASAVGYYGDRGDEVLTEGRVALVILRVVKLIDQARATLRPQAKGILPPVKRIRSSVAESLKLWTFFLISPMKNLSLTGKQSESCARKLNLSATEKQLKILTNKVPLA